MKKASSNIFMFAEVYGTMSSGRQGAPYFRRYGRELVSKPDISLKKSWGGYRRTTRELVTILWPSMYVLSFWWRCVVCVSP